MEKFAFLHIFITVWHFEKQVLKYYEASQCLNACILQSNIATVSLFMLTTCKTIKKWSANLFASYQISTKREKEIGYTNREKKSQRDFSSYILLNQRLHNSLRVHAGTNV